MNFAELSAQRYSLRKFSDRPVEDALLQQVLEAGRNAPTAHNNQPQRIFVLQSPEAMAKADACMGCHFHPPVLLAVAYDPAAAWDRECDGKNHGEIDATIAVTQMMLQAGGSGPWHHLRGDVRPGEADGGLPGDGRALSPSPCCRWAIPPREPIPPGCTRTASPWSSW